MYVGLRLYFPNLQKNWKLSFLNVALAGLRNFSQLMKQMENKDFEC